MIKVEVIWRDFVYSGTWGFSLIRIDAVAPYTVLDVAAPCSVGLALMLHRISETL